MQSDFLEEKDFSLLLYACDVILLPYRITSGSGVMFDSLAHGIPFLASDLAFFREFAGQGLGIVVKRNPTAFSDGIKKLDRNYSYYSQNVCEFKEKLKVGIFFYKNTAELDSPLQPLFRVTMRPYA